MLKAVIVRVGKNKCTVVKMYLKLRSPQLKTIMYVYRLLCINLMITINQKSTIDTHTKNRKESKHNTKDNHQIIRDNKRRKEQKRTAKTIFKMAPRTYISITTFNVNGPNAPIISHKVTECI